MICRKMGHCPSKFSPSSRTSSRTSIADNFNECKMSQIQVTDTKLFYPPSSRESRKYNIIRHIRKEVKDIASKSTNRKLVKESDGPIEQSLRTRLSDKSTRSSKKRHSTVLRNIPYKRRRIVRSKQNNQREIRMSPYLVKRKSRRKIKPKSKGRKKRLKKSGSKNSQRGKKRKTQQRSTRKKSSRSNIRKKQSGKKTSKISSQETSNVKKITPTFFKLIPPKPKDPLLLPQRVSIYSSTFNRANKTIKNIIGIEQTKLQKPQNQQKTSLLNCNTLSVGIENFHLNEFQTEQTDVQEAILPESGDSISVSLLDQNGKSENKVFDKENSSVVCSISDSSNNKKMKTEKTWRPQSQLKPFAYTSIKNMEKIAETECDDILNETHVLNDIQLPVCGNNISIIEVLGDESTSINIIPNKIMKSNSLPALQHNDTQIRTMINTLPIRNESEIMLKNCYKQKENIKISTTDIGCNTAEESDNGIEQSCSSKSFKKMADKANVYKPIRKSIQKPFLVLPNLSCLNWLKHLLKATDGINRI